MKLLDGIRDKVKEVYSRVGFDKDSQTEPLVMLKDMEGWLEYLLDAVKTVPPKLVQEQEEKKKKDRRDSNRKKKNAIEAMLNDARLKKSTARAKQDVVRRTGKAVMFRSAPNRKKKKKEEKEDKDEEREELLRFFT